MFRYYNSNPLGNNTADCTVRAISTAQGKTWDETYTELSYLAQKEGVIFDNAEFIENYLDKRYARKCFNSMTVGEFLEEFPRGTFLVTMKNHITCVKNRNFNRQLRLSKSKNVVLLESFIVDKLNKI